MPQRDIMSFLRNIHILRSLLYFLRHTWRLGVGYLIKILAL